MHIEISQSPLSRRKSAECFPRSKWPPELVIPLDRWARQM